ncbi:MAG TPA: hypothetical protein VN822_00580 [Candidatus Acidoferrales bacterium]|nr:hypothetical protein [Candidatus Acidoferrales bacterium]
MDFAPRKLSLARAAHSPAWWPVFVLIAVTVSFPSVAAVSQTGSSGESQLIYWQQITNAQLRLDGKAPLAWNVYQPGKKDKKAKNKDPNIVLLLLGHRYLMLDIRARLVYLVLPSDLHAQGKDFESGDLAQESRIIPTMDWTVRDVGPAELIRFTLGDYGRVLEVSLTHMPDMRPFY